jgi:hypothetical protein
MASGCYDSRGGIKVTRTRHVVTLYVGLTLLGMFLLTEGSLVCVPQPATGLYPEPDESIAQSHT